VNMYAVYPLAQNPGYATGLSLDRLDFLSETGRVGCTYFLENNS